MDRIVAIVDRDVILLSEAERAMRLLELRSDGETALGDVVERMIESRLIEREVTRFTDEPVSEERLADQVEEVRSRFPTDEAFHEMLAQRGLSDDQLRSELRRQLMVSRYLERRFRALTFVPDDDIARYFAEEVLPSLPSEREPTPEETDTIRRILEERRFNERVERWIEGLKTRAQIRRYVW